MLSTDSDPRVLKTIWLALAAGVFLFAAIVLFVLEPLDATVDAGLMRMVWFAVAVVATLGAGFTRGKLAASSAQGARTAAIVVWALAEGQGLVGLVGTMLTGDRMTAYGALALFVWLWLRYPPGAFDRRA